MSKQPTHVLHKELRTPNYLSVSSSATLKSPWELLSDVSEVGDLLLFGTEKLDSFAVVTSV